MVWGLFLADPLPGVENYYIFSKGTYKVGRKGCDVIVNKDKGVSRIHAEIIIDAMISIDNSKKKSSVRSSKNRIKDCSKYGTFIKKPLGSKEKVHEFPNKETTLDDEDLVSFGTGNASYRFTFIPLVFFLCGLESVQAKKLKEKISSIGASMTSKWSPECTHVLVDASASATGDLVDAIVAKKPFVKYNWVEFVAEKHIGTDIPSCSSYSPTLMLEGVSVKVADPESRENCLRGYTFLLESSDKYKVKNKLQTLLEAFGGKVAPVEEFFLNSQGLEDDENNHVVHVTPVGVGDSSKCSPNIRSLPKVNEINLITATLSGHLDPSVFVSPPVIITSSCSTDETVVADSEPEVEITSVRSSATIRKIESVEDERGKIAVHSVESIKHEHEVEMTVHSTEPAKLESEKNTTTDNISGRPKNDYITRLREMNDGISTREHKIDDPGTGSGNSDIIFSQDLIIRDTNLPLSIHSPMKSQVLNFKRFRKMGTQSGNSFYNLIPFAKCPYKDSEYEREEVAESVKEEKKRKQMEAVADDLFNNEKGKRRGVAGALQGLFARR